MRNKVLLVCALATGLLAAGPAFAHHGTAGYDMGKVVTLTGTVTKFDWSNPHVVVHLDAKDDSGNIQHWALELAAPLLLERSRVEQEFHEAGRRSGCRGHIRPRLARLIRNQRYGVLPSEVRSERKASGPHVKLAL